MNRRLSVRTSRRDRSASIAVVPDSRSGRFVRGSTFRDDDFRHGAEASAVGAAAGDGGVVSEMGSEIRGTGQLSPTMLVRARSERRQSSGSVRLWTASDLEDISADSWQRYFLRCFNVTPKGNVVSRGDYVRYRRIQSCCAATGDAAISMSTRRGSVGVGFSPTSKASTSLTVECGTTDNLGQSSSSSTSSRLLSAVAGMNEYVVHLIGSPGVGKTALTHQFTTSEHILNASGKCENPQDPIVNISLNGEETRLAFKEANSVESVLSIVEQSKPCAILVVYSITDLDSFLASTYTLCQLRQFYHDEVVIILVGNKSDLVRSRSVDCEEGHSLAANYKVKFIETSVGINYNVDELLVGVVTHLSTLNRRRTSTACSATRNRFNRCRTSLRRMFDRVLKKDEQQRDACDVLDTTPL